MIGVDECVHRHDAQRQAREEVAEMGEAALPRPSGELAEARRLGAAPRSRWPSAWRKKGLFKWREVTTTARRASVGGGRSAMTPQHPTSIDFENWLVFARTLSQAPNAC